LLEESFIHFPGIGSETECSLWNQGCHSWTELGSLFDKFSCGSADRNLIRESLVASNQALESGNFQYFRKLLGLKESWRAFPNFRHSCVYLDTETDGRNCGDAITTVGMFDGAEYVCLVKDDNLGNFPDIISKYSMIVTFYGSAFDVPILQKRFPSVQFDQLHLDLCFTLKRLGIKGGLKKIEKQLGIDRGEETEGLNGYDAVRLWQRYVRFDDSDALTKLIAYNREDVVNLEFLANYAYDNLWSVTRGARGRGAATQTGDRSEAEAVVQNDFV
jgi:uncharacterized protein YprB with RNaseH-like and TPR domain